MSKSKKPLVDFVEPIEKPSLVWARELLAALADKRDLFEVNPKGFLDRYEDFGYAPGLAKIQEWLDQQADPTLEAMTAYQREAEIEIHDKLGSAAFDKNNEVKALAVPSRMITYPLADLPFSWQDRL